MRNEYIRLPDLFEKFCHKHGLPLDAYLLGLNLTLLNALAQNPKIVFDQGSEVDQQLLKIQLQLLKTLMKNDLAERINSLSYIYERTGISYQPGINTVTIIASNGYRRPLSAKQSAAFLALIDNFGKPTDIGNFDNRAQDTLVSILNTFVIGNSRFSIIYVNKSPALVLKTSDKDQFEANPSSFEVHELPTLEKVFQFSVVTDRVFVWFGNMFRILSQQQSRLLLLLLRNQNSVCSKQQILEECDIKNEATLQEMIRQILEKINNLSLISTVWSLGYAVLNPNNNTGLYNIDNIYSESTTSFRIGMYGEALLLFDGDQPLNCIFPSPLESDIVRCLIDESEVTYDVLLSKCFATKVSITQAISNLNKKLSAVFNDNPSCRFYVAISSIVRIENSYKKSYFSFDIKIK